MSLVSWKLEKGLCRCCHAEGLFKSLSEPSFNLGQTEIFSEMLQQCLDIVMHPVQGEYSVATYTICDACIHRLRDATNFKQQVLKCEERFREMYSNVKSFHEVEVPVKMEESSSLCDFKEDLKEDHSDTDFGVQDEEEGDKAALQLLLEEEEDDDKTVLQLLLEGKKEKLKGKAKAKPKPKPKPKPKAKKAEPKRSARPQKPKPKPKEDKAEDQTAPKKGKKYAGRFVLKDTDYKQDGDDFYCTHCEKKYDKIFSLRFHIKTKHYKIPRFPCPYCGKAFMTPTPLTKHKLEEHNLDERAKCKACNAAFNTNVQLRKHINNFHMLGEKYKCEQCEYESFSFESMYKHKFKHKTVKDYHCRYCRKAFLRKATLDLHERIHTGDRRKVCKVCGQAFVQKASLNYHMTKYHPEVNF